MQDEFLRLQEELDKTVVLVTHDRALVDRVATRIVELAREIHPGIDTLVRTHNDGERRHFEEQGVGLVLMAERELAFGMTLYALRSLGLKEGEARIFVDSTRVESRSAPIETAIDQVTPELRPHKEAGA